MEAVIPATVECEMRSMITFLNAQSIAPVEIHRQLCQVYGHTRLDGQHSMVSTSPAGVQWIPSFLIPHEILVRSAFSEWQRSGYECHCGSNPRWQTSTTQGYKDWSYGITIVSIPEVNILKISSTLAVSVPINLSIKIVFFSVNCPR